MAQPELFLKKNDFKYNCPINAVFKKNGVKHRKDQSESVIKNRKQYCYLK